MPEPVLIKGGGLAACCCATLLHNSGYRVIADFPARPISPMLLLSEQTQRLLLDVFGLGDLFIGSVPIRKRVVLWGGHKEASVFPHSGLVISEAVLLSRLSAPLALKGRQARDSVGWSVISSGAAHPLSAQHGFGSRTASTNSVDLRTIAQDDCCWIESVPNGWLFLIPCGHRKGSLICVGASPGVLLPDSTLVANQISSLNESTGSFPAYPRIVSPLCGPGWIACGTAAVAFDPIAGEGAGNALREGILASALIRAASKSDDEKDLLAHYSNRLLHGFLRHLQECCSFYEAVNGGWWESELEHLRQGVGWVRQELAAASAARFRLQGFNLQSIGS